MQNRCPCCLEPIAEKEICKNCGYDPDKANLKSGPKTGSIIKDRYYFGNIYAENKASTVYVAYDEQNGTKVFIREFTGAELEADSGLERTALMERFINYQKSLASINLCKLLPRTVELFSDDDAAYKVTEYFDGESLKELITSGIKISRGNALKITEQLVSGLKLMHNSRMIFGALSPETLYILKDGSVRIFGLGSPFFEFLKDIDSKVKYINPSYAAPEIFESGGKRGSFCDVYSVAAILYRILTDIIPPVSFLRSGGESVKTPSKISTDINDTFSNAILNALNWQIECRTSSLEGFLKELGAQNTKRRYSSLIIWSMVLGFGQGLYDSYLERQNAKSKKAQNITDDEDDYNTPKSAKTKKAPKLLWLWITIPAILLAIITAILIILLVFGKGDNTPVENSSKGDGWYYGSGIETPVSSDESTPSRKPSSDTSSKQQLGADQTLCPDVISVTLATARRDLENAGLEVGTIRYTYSNDYFKDYVISQSIAPDSVVAKGTKVDLVVCNGTMPDEVITLPNVKGKELFAALSELNSAGIENVKVEFKTSGDTVGTVVDVKTPEGEIVSPQTTVTLTVIGEKITLPDFTGMTLKEVMDYGLDVKVITVSENGGTMNVAESSYSSVEVVSQNPIVDTIGYKGMELVLTIKFK